MLLFSQSSSSCEKRRENNLFIHANPALLRIANVASIHSSIYMVGVDMIIYVSVFVLKRIIRALALNWP